MLIKLFKKNSSHIRFLSKNQKAVNVQYNTWRNVCIYKQSSNVQHVRNTYQPMCQIHQTSRSLTEFLEKKIAPDENVTENNLKEENGQDENNIVRENQESYWYHEKILAIPGYSEIVVKLPTKNEISNETAEQLLKSDWKTMSTDEIVSNFETLCSYIFQNIQNTETINYASVLECISTRLVELNNKQIEAMLIQYQLLRRLNNRDEHARFLKAVDAELLTRSYETLEERLKICDLLHMIHASKRCYTFFKFMKRLSSKIKRMTKQQLVHYCYLLILNNQCKQNMYEIEYYVNLYIKDMDINEFCIVALVFFKRRYRIYDNNLLSIFMDKMLKNIDKMETYNIATMMKFFRRFRNVEQSQQMREIFAALENKTDKLSTVTMTQMLHASADNVVYNENLVNRITERFMNEVTKCRLKDLERFSLAASAFSFDPEHPAFPKIMSRFNEYFNNNDERIKFMKEAKAIPYSCMFLGQTGYYNLPILEKIMNPEFYNKIYNSLTYSQSLEYLWLDQSIEIECPDYKGHRLDEKTITFIAKYFNHKVPNFQMKHLSTYNKLVLDALKECMNLLGENNVTLAHILPHYIKPDLIVALDKNNKALPVKEMLSSSETIKNIPEEFKTDVKWFTIIIETECARIINNNQFVGKMNAKMRQLERLGYIPVTINYNTWISHTTKRDVYLSSLIFDENERFKVKNKLFIEQ